MSHHLNTLKEFPTELSHAHASAFVHTWYNYWYGFVIIHKQNEMIHKQNEMINKLSYDYYGIQLCDQINVTNKLTKQFTNTR